MALISTIGIVTADRPASLDRAVASLIPGHEPRRPPPRLLIIDGSRTRTHRHATQAVARRAAARTGAPVRYIGHAEAAFFCSAIGLRQSSMGPLLPGPVAHNRNLLLLLTAGEHVLWVDDDVVAEPRVLSNRRPGLMVVGHQEHRDFLFFRSRRAALAAAPGVQTPLLDAHEQMLGRTLSALLAAHASNAEIRECCGHVASRLAAGQPMVVKATFTGLVGDAATYCPRLFLLSGPGSLRDRFWTSEPAFRSAMASRESVRIAAVDYVTHNANCMTTCMALSNRTLMPPFPWIGGNEDGVFGALLGSMDLSALFGHLSLGVVHDSSRPSSYTGHRGNSAYESRVSELLIGIIRQATPALDVVSPAAWLRRLGSTLAEIGSWNTRDLRSFVTALTMTTRWRQFDAAEAASHAGDCPGYWRRALAEYRREFAAHALADNFCLPVEFNDGESVDVGFRRLAAFLRRYGAFIQSWPELWNQARHLNAARPKLVLRETNTLPPRA